MFTGYVELLKSSGERVKVPSEKYNSEYLVLKNELNSPQSKKQKLLSLFRSEIDPVDFCSAEIERRALREFNVESGPYWKPFVMYAIYDQLSSGERLSFGEMAQNLHKLGLPYDSEAVPFKLELLGRLLVLTEQNLLQRTREEGKWIYSFISTREVIPKIEKLSQAFFGLRRGQKLETQILC